MALAFALSTSAAVDRKLQAREQFEHAVKLRTTLEGTPDNERSLVDYRQALTAYHKVYLISPQAEEVTPSLVAEAELYDEMGRLFDEKFFQSAVETYQFLLKQYPGSRFRSQAMYAIGEIQKEGLHQPDVADASLKDYLKHFPKAEHSDEARALLQQMAAERVKAKEEALAAAAAAAVVAASDALPEIIGKEVQQRESDNGTPRVLDIKTWNAANAVRIVVTLDGTIAFNASRIASPDRIYFDLHRAQLTPAVAKKDLDVKDGLLKSVRIAQNKAGVVRVVLDVDGAHDYTARLLANPYRLVIEVRNKPAMTTARIAAPAPVTAAAVAPPPAIPTPSVVYAAKGVAEKPAAKPDFPSDTATALPDDNAAMATKKPVSKTKGDRTAVLVPPSESKPTRDGQRSLTRALGLKISRIVIDPGHGGHDTGTIGPHGLMEKDLCLDVALRLGHEIEEKLPGAEVVYTRKDDTFIPLEQRTAIANEAKADLFISIHANSSHDEAARGIETYYLNFATSEESMEVAARENALSQESLHDLQDIIKKIARNEKVEESKELASDIQDSLAHRLQLVSQNERNRGVKKAPFVVLIGANMPSVLSEISFISNPSDERLLKKTDQRQRVADGLYRGIASYLESLNSLSYDKSKLVSDNHSGSGGGSAIVAAEGNPK
ncbi:MAG: N-acetylmuramoyl-L-alanine amidase [Candidatus Acidiferrales bacterium]